MLIKEKHITRMGVGPLCKLFGKSRQAFYQKEWHLSDTEQMELIVLELVAQVRRELPGLGLHKLYKCIYQPLRTNHIKIGRDKLNTLLRNHGLLISRKLRGPRTTQSNHMFWKYPDLAKNLEINRSEQLWVADITYICITYDFNYLSLITDAYSRKIMGYCLHPYLTNEGTINALNMALNNRTTALPLMHHSDRGVQYCSYDYINLLNKEKIAISMTQHGEAYENPIAERINGILKTEFNLSRIFKSRSEALSAVKIAIEAYNNVRPHMSCSNLTPAIAHQTSELLIKCWKNRRKKRANPVLVLNQLE
jgi:putative transposase